MNGETCHCPCCQQGIEAPHEYHLERRPMAVSGMVAFDRALGSLLERIDAEAASAANGEDQRG